MQRILVVFGTRPEAIKLAPVICELRRWPERYETSVCVTGQHRRMLDQVLRHFAVDVDRDLDLMRPGQDPSDVACGVLQGLREVLKLERPDRVLVQGDTTTALSAALAAFHARVAVGHVEAGLRTGDLKAPFPEEMNRRVLGVVADLHFAPTESARRNLLREGVADSAIVVSGNTAVDALLRTVERLRDDAALRGDVAGRLPLLDPARRLLLVTGHRRESFGSGLREICEALRDLAGLRPDVQIVYPVHLNPEVQEPVRAILGDVPSIRLLEPLDYPAFVHLMQQAYVILTDSGGIQEEAPALGRPVLVLREASERPEALAAGTARLVGTEREAIVRETLHLLDERDAWEAMARAHSPFGDGRAAERIVAALAGARR